MTEHIRTWAVDASVAAKWFVPEIDSELAAKLVSPFVRLVAPDLLYAELGSVFLKRLARGDITEADCKAAIRNLDFMTVTTEPMLPLAKNAFRIARDTQRSFYDCLYLALAASHKTQLITEDQRLWNALRGTPYAKLAVRLEAVAE